MELILTGKISEIDKKEKNGNKFIFIENGRYPVAVSIKADSHKDYVVGTEIKMKVENRNGVINGTDRAWQFFVEV